MDYKMIALDIDDTLLKKDLTIGEKTKKALLDAKNKGVKIVLASGRPSDGMESLAKELELNSNGYIISFNGAYVKDCSNNEVIFKQALSKENLHKVYDLSVEYNITLITYLDKCIITDKPNKYAEIESEITGIPLKIVENFKEYCQQDVIKAMGVEEPTYLSEVKEKMIDKMGDVLSITTSKPFFLEIMDKGVDKGKSLKFLAEKLDIDIKEVIAIGDSYNDITMIEKAGLGVAMGNANDDVKKIADIVVSDNDNDGIAEVIEKYILKGE